MPHTACVAMAFVLALQTGARPLVLGNAATRVTADDLSAVSRVAGEPIWLMRIDNGFYEVGSRPGQAAPI